MNKDAPADLHRRDTLIFSNGMFFSIVMVVHARQTKDRLHLNSLSAIGILAICVEEGGNIMQDSTAKDALNVATTKAPGRADDALNESADELVNEAPDPVANESVEWCVPIYHPILLIPTDTVPTKYDICLCIDKAKAFDKYKYRFCPETYTNTPEGREELKTSLAKAGMQSGGLELAVSLLISVSFNI
jgi:hypothetical protein